jgi:hypothetical protein
MKKNIYWFLLVIFCMVPLKTFAQGWIPWPAVEDTMLVDAVGVDSLNEVIARDTAGLSWQGTHGRDAYLGGTRVYVLKANATYRMYKAFNLRPNRALRIRGQNSAELAASGYRDYAIPAKDFFISPWRPKIVIANTSTNFTTVNCANDTIALKDLAIVGYDENGDPNMVDQMAGVLISSSSSGINMSMYLDGVVLHQAYASFVTCLGDVKTFRAQNCYFLDAGFLGRYVIDAGRGIDFRNVGADTIDIENNTFINIQDRIVRHLNSVKPFKTFIFDHNTVINAASYHGLLSLGWIDSTGAGTFKITNNFFVDAFAMGPDTDWSRQSEFVDNPDIDPLNGLPKMAWVVARKNTTSNITPWIIDYNYYYTSDSGQAIRDANYPLHPGAYSGSESFMTSDIARQVDAYGGDTNRSYIPIVYPEFIGWQPPPLLMSKLIRWYWSPFSESTQVGLFDPDSTSGAGAGKMEDKSAPIDNFTKMPLATGFNRWPYDMNRRLTDTYFDSLDCDCIVYGSYYGTTDGKDIGSSQWEVSIFRGINTRTNQLPEICILNHNYPNPFNPLTKIVYSIPNARKVTLQVYNLLGQVVATLVDEKQQAGEYPVMFDASNLASGIYFYRITAGSFTAAKKMVLIK